MANEGKSRLVVEKTQLLREFQTLAKLMANYQKVLEQLSDSEEWGDEIQKHLQAHQALHYHARFSVGTVNLVFALLKDVLGRLTTSSLNFQGDFLSSWEEQDGGGNSGGEIIAPEQMIAWVGKALESAPLEMQDTLRRLMRHVLDFIQQLETENAASLEGTIARINLVTSNRQSQEMLREIIMITRDIYNSLEQVSDGLPLEMISETTGSLSEQVKRLRNVIIRLDESAAENLEILESLISQGNTLKGDLGIVLEGVQEAQLALTDIKEKHPTLIPSLDPLLDQLGDEVGAPVMSLIQYTEQSANDYMELMSNLSFQEMTGKTLVKIIDFIEGLEHQLLDVLNQYKPGYVPPPPSVKDEEPAKSETPIKEAEGTQSQADVDKLLAELNF